MSIKANREQVEAIQHMVNFEGSIEFGADKLDTAPRNLVGEGA